MSGEETTNLGSIRFGNVRNGERRLRSFSFVNPGPMELIVTNLKLVECSDGNEASNSLDFSVQRQPSLPHKMQPHETCKCVKPAFYDSLTKF